MGGGAAAMNLSFLVADYIGTAVKVSDKWLPVISFIVVFLLVALLVRWVAAIVQRTIEIAMLGWLNRIGGIIVYAILYVTIFSVVLFYAQQVRLDRKSTRLNSSHMSIS